MKKKTIDKIALKVLYLEDSPRDIEIIRELLIDAGYDLSMDCTEKKKEFTSLLHRNTYDVILSDFKLPGFDAFGALKLSVDICPEVPLICVSGSIGEETAIELIKQGAVDYVLKDRLVRLPLAIKRALDESNEKKSRQIAEEALRESEEQFRLLFNSSMDAVLLTSPTDEIFSVNPAACKMFQYTEEELCSIGRRGIVDASDPRLAIALKERTRTGRFIGELTLLRKDGSKFLAEISSVIFKDKKGSDHTSMIIRDITERKQADEALRSSEEKFRKAFMTSPDSITINRVFDGLIVSINKGFTRLMGYNEEEVVGKTSAELDIWYDPADRDRLVEGLKKDGVVENIFARFRTKKGEIRYGMMSACIIELDEIPHILSITRDITESRRIEETLHASEQKYRRIFENVQDVYYETLFDGTILEVSPSIELISKGQYRREDLIGKLMYEFYPDTKDRDTFIATLQKTGRVTDFEIQLKNRDGSLIPCSISAKISFDAQGRPDKIIGSMHDISRRKQAEEVLQKSEERLRITLEATKIGIWEWDLKNNVMYASPTMYSMLGCKPDEKVKDQDIWLNRIHPEDRQMVEDKTKNAFTNQTENYEYTVRMKHADGSYRWINVQGYVMDEDASGNATRISGIRVDITERKQAEEAQKESESKFRKIIESSKDGIIFFDGKTQKILFGNGTMAELLGCSKEDLIGRSIQSLHPSEEWVSIEKEFQKHVRGELSLSTGIQVFRNDSSIFYADISSSLITLEGKSYFSAFFRDITKRKRAEDALRESERQISLIYDTVGDIVYNLKVEKEGNYIFTSVNRCFLTVTGLQANQIIGKRVQDVIPEPSLTIVLEKYAEAIQQKKIVRWEETTEYPTGRVTGEVSIAPVFDDTGHCTYLTGTVHDVTERKHAEEALIKNEKKLKELFEDAPVGYHEIDEHGNITAVNQTELKMLGFTTIEEMIGFSVWEFVADNEESRKRTLGKLAGNLPPAKNSERFIVRKDGTSFPALIDDIILRNEQGKITGIRTTLLDITDRKRAEEALAKERNLLRTLIDALPDRIYAKDTQGRFTLNNISHLKALGVKSQEEALGKTDYDFRPKEFADRYFAGDKQVLQTGKPIISLEDRAISVSGEIRWVLSTKVPLYDTQGNIIGLVGNSSDITERKRSEELLRETRDYLENLLSFANTPIIVWDPNFKITRFNVAIEKLTGYTLQEVIGKHLEILLPLENKKTSLSLIVPTSEGDHLVTVEIPILCKNGNVRTVIWSSANIYAADGQTLVSTIAQGQDITEQKKLQQELLQSQKMESIGTLAGGIAHDFNNILGIILGYSSLMEKGTLSPDKFNESLGIIKNAVGRGAALVKQILTFARKTDVVFGPVSIYDLIHELLSMLKQTFPRVITFIEIVDQNIPFINADRTQIHQVMLNLCVNARDAMPNGGTITIKTEKQTKSQVQEKIPAADQDSYICISVTDTGMGMDEATRRQIFDPFFTTKEQGKGTGLGLAVVYGVIQSHHGFIDVESEVGRGTTFWLYFPIPQASELSADVSILTESFVKGGTETILIVEDEEVLIEIVRLLLESKGYKVHTAKDGNEAINIYKLHKQEINLVITDMGLPGMTGMDVFKKLREIDSNVNVIVASGFFEREVRSELTAHGAKGFIQKPYTPDDVLRKIREVLDAKKD